jgi:hypothetical protein
MALVLIHSFKSFTGADYVVEIHHKTNTPTPITVELEAGGFELDYEGQGATNFETQLQSSSASISLIVSSSDIQTAVEAIADSKENSYFLIIKRNTLMYWHGMIVCDQITMPRGSFQGSYSVAIKANDRLKILDSIDFDFGTFALPGNRATALSIIDSILQRNYSYVVGLYAVGARWIGDSIPFKTGGQLDGTLNNIAIKKESIYTTFEINEDIAAEAEYKSCSEVIKSILAIFNAKILLSNGVWYITTAENNLDTSTSFNIYDKGLNKITNQTYANGIAVNDASRSCFVAMPNYTWQPAIRQITGTVTKKNASYDDTLTSGVFNKVFSQSGILTINEKSANIFAKLTGLKLKHVIGADDYTAERVIVFADFWLKAFGGDYWYLSGGQLLNNGPTIPVVYDQIGVFDVKNNPSLEIIINKDVQLPNLDFSEYRLNLFGKTDFKSNLIFWRTITVNGVPEARSYSKNSTENTEGVYRMGVQFSYNSWQSEENQIFEKTFLYRNAINPANNELSNNPDHPNIYYSGGVYDIYGLTQKVSGVWDGAVFSIDHLTVTTNTENLGVILAANLYEDNKRTIEGELFTNGAIHAINSINIDSAKWYFLGGRYNAQNETWNGQWLKIVAGTVVKTGGGTTTKGGGLGAGGAGAGVEVYELYKKIANVWSNGFDGSALVRKVLNDNGTTNLPTGDELKNVNLFYDYSENVYSFALGDVASPALPFDVTASPLTLETGLTGDFTLTGNYFREDSVVTISSGTLNTVTVNSMTEMVLNITASAIGESVDVTIDGVVFAGLFSYIEVVVVYVPGDGTTNWTDTLEVTTGNGTIRPLSSTAWGGSGAGASAVAAAGKDVVFSCKVNQFSFSNVACMIGLDATNPNRNYNTIDYALFFLNTSNLGVYENGSNKGTSLETFTHGDTFQIRRIGTTVSYHKNGSLTPFYTSLTASIGTLGIDSAFSGTPRVEFIECSIEF